MENTDDVCPMIPLRPSDTIVLLQSQWNLIQGKTCLPSIARGSLPLIFLIIWFLLPPPPLEEWQCECNKCIRGPVQDMDDGRSVEFTFPLIVRSLMDRIFPLER